MQIKLGNIEQSASSSVRRMSALLWGGPSTGKTVLAYTAPKKILWLQFDPDGINSLILPTKLDEAGNRVTDYDAAGLAFFDFSVYPDNFVETFINSNPHNIEKTFADNPDIKTVVVDSVTSFGEKALRHGVNKGAVKVTRGERPTLDNPGFVGYGYANTYVNQLIQNLTVSTGKFGVHIIFISHESAPQLNKDGNIESVTLMLAGKLAIQVPKNISECWFIQYNGQRRLCYVQNHSYYRPMRTRMFDLDVKVFPLTYDAKTGQGQTISAWIDAWRASGYQRIQP